MLAPEGRFVLNNEEHSSPCMMCVFARNEKSHRHSQPNQCNNGCSAHLREMLAMGVVVVVVVVVVVRGV